MYEICYQLLTDTYPQEYKFDHENDMEGHYNIWVAGEDYHFCDFYYCGIAYIPKWME